jgi:histidinol-phosphate aminotransferase
LKDYSKDYFTLLKDNNIMGGRTTEEEGKWSRITVGTMDEMKQYIKALQ